MMNMEESKAAPTFANHDEHCQRCLVAEVEFLWKVQQLELK